MSTFVVAHALNLPAPFAAAWEPTVATDSADARRIAVVFQRRSSRVACGIETVIRVSRDGGRTWHDTRGGPLAGTGRGADFHATIAWGPGPGGGSRLWWADVTAPASNCGAFSASIAWSDDEGATWRSHVEHGTPPWIGGFPDVTVDRDPASPNYGAVYLAYNWLASARTGPGLRIIASGDFGATWHRLEVPKAPPPAGYPAAWRIDYRVRTGPDGSLYVAAYQADLRRWDSRNVFSQGGSANVGRLGFTVAHIQFDRRRGTFQRGPTVVATTLARNAYTINGAGAPGTDGSLIVHPSWQIGLDVDRASGAVYLAIGDWRAAAPGGTPMGVIRVGRSDDAGRTWSWTTLAVLPPIAGHAQSAWKPNVVARDGLVVVTFHGVGRTAGGRVTVGQFFAVSRDGGQSFAATGQVDPTRWDASALAGTPNAAGLRERADWTADGRVVWVWGDGREAAPGPSHLDGRTAIYGALITP